jgi:hypothetical protein
MTLQEILEKRAVAGARYAAATGELHDSLIELAALDEVLASSRAGFDGAPNVRTFVGMIQNLAQFSHPKFAVVDPAICWREEVKARRDAILAQIEETVR